MLPRRLTDIICVQSIWPMFISGNLISDILKHASVTSLPLYHTKTFQYNKVYLCGFPLYYNRPLSVILYIIVGTDVMLYTRVDLLRLSLYYSQYLRSYHILQSTSEIFYSWIDIWALLYTWGLYLYCSRSPIFFLYIRLLFWALLFYLERPLGTSLNSFSFFPHLWTFGS